MSNPIYLALDVPQIEAAKALLTKARDHIGGVKLGLEFFNAHGHHGVHEIAQVGLPIFLDLKLHDIPNTVAGAMQAIHVLEPAIVTVHASGGRAMMEDAKAAAATGTKAPARARKTAVVKEPPRPTTKVCPGCHMQKAFSQFVADSELCADCR